jgi:hypothetical protein
MEHDEACALAPEGLPDPIGGYDVVIFIQIATGNHNAVALADIFKGVG